MAPAKRTTSRPRRAVTPTIKDLYTARPMAPVDRSTVFGPAAKPQNRGRTELVVLPTNATADHW
jgi:hypothetical protein